MNIVTVLIYILVISLSFSLGFILGSLFKNIKNYSGTIKVTREENRVLYSLELDEDPSMLEFMPEVVFKVETSDESSDRK